MTKERPTGWAEYYDKLRDRPPRRTLLAALDRFGPATSDSLAVDLGCGTGALTAQIAARGASVIGLDASEEMILAARTAFPAIDFRVADARKFAVGEPQAGLMLPTGAGLLAMLSMLKGGA